MPNFQQLIGEEIRRLARKELKSAVEPLKSQIGTLRKNVATQNRRIATLEKALRIETSRTVEPMAAPAPIAAAEPGKVLRITPERIRKLREKLGVSQERFAELLGVNLHSVSRWESGKTSPRPEQKARIAAIRDMGKTQQAILIRGVDAAPSLPESARPVPSNSAFDRTELTAFRETRKLAKVQLAVLLGVNENSVGNWESGKTVPREAYKAKFKALLPLSMEQIQTRLAELRNKAKDTASGE